MEIAEALELLPGAVVSHRCAAQIWGVPFHKQLGAALTVPRSCRRRLAGAKVYRRDLQPADKRCREGLVVTSPLRTAVDCGRDVPFEKAVVILDRLLNRQRLTRSDLFGAAQRQLGPGSTALRRAVRMTDAGAGSGLETAARLLFLGGGLSVVSQYRLHRDTHAYDFAIVAHRLLIEVEGFGYHASRDQLDRDARYATEAAVDGWRLLRFTWEDITLRPAQTLATISAAIAGVR